MKFNAVLDVSREITGDELVTLEEVKQQGRIDTDEEDDLLTMYISAAREMIEAYLNVSLVQCTVTANLRNDLGDMYLPYGPVIAVTSFVQDNSPMVPIPAEYYRLAGAEFKRIVTAFCEPITVVYTAGYTTVPDYLKVAVLQQVAFMYQNRGDVQKVISPQVQQSLYKYRRV